MRTDVDDTHYKAPGRKTGALHDDAVLLFVCLFARPFVIRQKLYVLSYINPLIATLKPQSNGPSYSNTMIGTLVVGWWAVTFGTARRGLGGAAARLVSSSLCNSSPIKGQCNNFILFDVALYWSLKGQQT